MRLEFVLALLALTIAVGVCFGWNIWWLISIYWLMVGVVWTRKVK